MKRIFFFALFICLALAAAAQVVDTTGLQENPIFQNPTLDKMIEWYNLLYGALVVVLGMVFKALGVKKQIPNFFLVIATTGVILGGAMLASGVGEVLPLAFSFFSAIGFYESMKRSGFLAALRLQQATQPPPPPPTEDK